MKLQLKFFYSTLILFLLMPLANHAQLVNFTKTDCDGVEHDLFTDLQAGNAVILNFCAGWCGPCRLADPYLEEFYQETCEGTLNIKTYGMLFENNSRGQTDCVFGQDYASQYGLTFPIITDCSDIYYSHFSSYANFLPLFLVIIPDTVNPENSEVIVMIGAEVVGQGWENLSNAIKDVLKENGFLPGITSTLEELCVEEPFTVELSSNFTDGNTWSTGETTQSITVNSFGTYSLQNNALCNEFNDTITFSPLPVAGFATSSETELCVGDPFNLNYSGGNGTAIWETFIYEENNWISFGPALTSITGIPKSSNPVDRFRVRIDNGSPIGQTSCITYSEEVIISSPSNSPSLEISDINPCYRSSINITANSDILVITDGILQFSIPNESEEYFEIQPLDTGVSVPFLLDESYAGKTLRFRYLYFNADTNCLLYSNTVDVTVSEIVELNWPNCLYLGESLSIDNVDNSLPILWSTGETTDTILPLTSGNVSVTYTDNLGCENTFNKQIEVIDNINPGTVSISINGICWAGEEDYFELIWVGSGNVIWQMSPNNGVEWFSLSEINELTQGYFNSLGWPDHPNSGEPILYPTAPIFDYELFRTYTFRVAAGCEDNYRYSNEVSFSYFYQIYEDLDGDGYGASDSSPFCSPDEYVTGYTDNNLDCDDFDPGINPGINEICDGFDNNCDGIIDEGFDADNDGVADCFDNCPLDANKTEPGVCGCGIQDLDDDEDGTLNCEENDNDDDGVDNCFDNEENSPCPNNVDEFGVSIDIDGDGILDCNDLEINSPCPDNVNQDGVSPDNDSDFDGVIDCLDAELNSECPNDVDVNGISLDSDNDGIPDCLDTCNGTLICHVKKNGTMVTLCLTDKELQRHLNHADDNLTGPCPNEKKEQNERTSNNLSIVPNPASDKVTFTVLNNVSKNAELNIYNSLGVLLESFPLKGQKEIKFKIKSMYTSGMYIAEINDQGVIERGKFIINK